MDVTLLFGSNQGDRKAIIEDALERMTVIGPIKIRSSMYETAPWGFESDEAFYNMAATYATNLAPIDVLQKCLEVEKTLGRKRNGIRYSSRPIDIDILFYGDDISETPELVIPHPRMTIRNFVLTPLAEIMPHFVHPVAHKTVATLLQECPDSLPVKRLQDIKATDESLLQ